MPPHGLDFLEVVQVLTHFSVLIVTNIHVWQCTTKVSAADAATLIERNRQLKPIT